MSTVAPARPVANAIEGSSAVKAPPIAVDGHPSWPMTPEVPRRIVDAGIMEGHGRVYLGNGRLCRRMSIDRPRVLGVRNVLLASLGADQEVAVVLDGREVGRLLVKNLLP